MRRAAAAGDSKKYRVTRAFGRRILLRVGIPVVLAAVLATTFFALTPRPNTGSSAGGESGGGNIAGAASFSLASFADARDRMNQLDRTFTVQVIGDSTGNDQGEWVDIAFRPLAVQLDRPLVQHPWDVFSNSYLEPITANPTGSNAALVVWNGSASGKTAEYSLLNVSELVPEQPDLILLNHGLNNVLEPAQVPEQFTALVAEVERTWPATIGYAALLENPRLDQHAAAHDAVIGYVNTWLAEHQEVRRIDVHSAYLESGNVAALLQPDLLHPAPAGSALTAATVLAALNR